MQVKKLLSPNYGYPRGTSGRKGHKIIAIVNHVSGGTWESNKSWILNPESTASYNYYIKKDGQRIMFVEEKNAAWSNGRANKPLWPLIKTGVNPNLYTISICREGHNHHVTTEEQYKGILETHVYLIKKYEIPIDRQHIIGHNLIDSVNRQYCPGSGFPWDRLFEDLEISFKKPSWKTTMGINAVLGLSKKDLINTEEFHIQEVQSGRPPKLWLFFVMLERICTRKSGFESLDWQEESGLEALNNLVKIGLINTPAVHEQNLKQNRDLEPWLFFTLIDRTTDSISFKSSNWRQELGEQAIRNLAAKNIISDPEMHITNMNKPLEPWLFYSLIERVSV